MAKGSRFDSSLAKKNPKAIPDIVALDLEFPKWRRKATEGSWREEGKIAVKQKRPKDGKGLWERGRRMPSGIEPWERVPRSGCAVLAGLQSLLLRS